MSSYNGEALSATYRLLGRVPSGQGGFRENGNNPGGGGGDPDQGIDQECGGGRGGPVFGNQGLANNGTGGSLGYSTIGIDFNNPYWTFSLPMLMNNARFAPAIGVPAYPPAAGGYWGGGWGDHGGIGGGAGPYAPHLFNTPGGHSQTGIDIQSLGYDCNIMQGGHPQSGGHGGRRDIADENVALRPLGVDSGEGNPKFVKSSVVLFHDKEEIFTPEIAEINTQHPYGSTPSADQVNATCHHYEESLDSESDGDGPAGDIGSASQSAEDEEDQEEDMDDLTEAVATWTMDPSQDLTLRSIYQLQAARFLGTAASSPTIIAMNNPAATWGAPEYTSALLSRAPYGVTPNLGANLMQAQKKKLTKKQRKAEKRARKAAKAAKNQQRAQQRALDANMIATRIRRFLEDNQEYTLTFSSMSKANRAGVRNVAMAYNLQSTAKGKGKNRPMTLWKTPQTGVNVNYKKLDSALRGWGAHPEVLQETRPSPMAPFGSSWNHAETGFSGPFRNAGSEMGRIADVVYSTSGNREETHLSGPRRKAGSEMEQIPVVKTMKDDGPRKARHQDGDIVGQHAEKIDENNVGYRLLQAMGWSPGDKIGVTGGLEAPLEAVIKVTKLGLGATK